MENICAHVKVDVENYYLNIPHTGEKDNPIPNYLKLHKIIK